MSSGNGSRPPRALVVSSWTPGTLHAVERWHEALGGQQTDLLWDVLVIDGALGRSPPGYLAWLNGWATSRPFGPRHKVRLLRFGPDADGMRIAPPYRAAYALGLAWERFCRWRSYDALWSLAVDVVAPPAALELLWASGEPWAAAWRPPRPTAAGMLPSLPSSLACTLLRRELVDSVAYPGLSDRGAELTLAAAAVEAGWIPTCIPAVVATHVEEWEAACGDLGTATPPPTIQLDGLRPSAFANPPPPGGTAIR